MSGSPSGPEAGVTPFIAVAVGLRFEAAIARRDRSVRICCGRGRGLGEALEAVIKDRGCAGVLSFGLAGGLDPALAAGQVVVASAVISAGSRIATDASWSERLLARGRGTLYRPVLGVCEPLPTRAEKLRLFRATGAAAADMESHLAARIASARNLPFAVFRVVADAADRDVPPAAIAAMRPDGTLDIGALMMCLARHPGQIPSLLALARDAWAARRTLAAPRGPLGRGFGRFDLG